MKTNKQKFMLFSTILAVLLALNLALLPVLALEENYTASVPNEMVSSEAPEAPATESAPVTSFEEAAPEEASAVSVPVADKESAVAEPFEEGVLAPLQEWNANFNARSIGLDGRFGFNKTGENLNNPGVYPAGGDVLLFTAMATNNSASSNMFLTDLTDTFSKTLSPYNGGNTSSAGTNAIDTTYLAAEGSNNAKAANVVVWVRDDETGKITRIANQANVIKKVEIQKSATDPDKNQIVVTFKDYYFIGSGYTLMVSYTLCVSDTFAPGDNIKNEFEFGGAFGSPGSADGIPGGSFEWRQPSFTVQNKTASNITKGVDASAEPIAKDILLFSVDLVNETGQTLSGLSVEDTYTENLAPYTSLAGLNETHSDYAILAAANNAAKMNLALKDGPAGFDITKVDLRFDTGGAFSLSLGTNSLKAGERVTLLYTMQVGDGVKAGDLLRNLFVLKAGSQIISNGYCEITASADATKAGFASVVKSVAGVENAGVTPSTQYLINGDKITFSVDIANYHTRIGKTLHVKNIIDALPDNLKLVGGSVHLYNETLKVDSSGVIVKDTSTEINGNEYNVKEGVYTVDNGTELLISLKAPVELKSDLLSAAGGKPEAKNHLLLEYTCVVDTNDKKFPDLGESLTVARRNNVAVFFTETADEIKVNSGNGPVDDTSNNIDNDSSTKSYVNNTCTVGIYNDKNLQATIEKTIDAPEVQIPTEDAARTYKVSIDNHSLVPLDLSKIVDILPPYETLDTSKPAKIMLTGFDGTEYGDFALTYEFLEDYKNLIGVTSHRFMFTGFTDGTEQPLSVPEAGRDTEGEILPTHAVLEYSTTIDADGAIADFQKSDINSYNYITYAAMYLEDNDKNISIVGGKGSKHTGDDAEKYSNWDGDQTTSVCYFSVAKPKLTAKSTAPFVALKPYTILQQLSGKSEDYVAYAPDKSSVEPGDIVAWDIIFGNSNNAQHTLKAGTRLMFVLPDGLTWQGFGLDADGEPAIPAYLPNNGTPEIITSGTSTALVWTLEKDCVPGSGETFRIRTLTRAIVYASYTPTALLIPTDAEDQYFFGNVIRESIEYNGKYSYNAARMNLQEWLGESASKVSLVRTSSSLSALGQFGINSKLVVRNGRNTKSSLDADRILGLNKRDAEFTYTMELSAENAPKGFDNAVLICRLPYGGDADVLNSASPRGSQAQVKMTDGELEAKVVLSANQNSEDPLFIKNAALPNASWISEYFTGPQGEEFTSADWENTANSGRWVTFAQAQAVGFDKVTAVRVRLINDFKIQNGYALRVSFQAKAQDYNVGGLIAWNSFAFSGYVDEAQMQAEPLAVGVTASVPFDRAIITTVLKDSKPQPRFTSFDTTFTGTGAGGAKEIRNFTATVHSTGDNAQWTGTHNEYLLPQGYSWEIATQVPSIFEEPTYSIVPYLNSDGTTTWLVQVENTPITNTIVYNANEGSGSVADDHSPYYTTDSVTVLGSDNLSRAGYTFLEWNTLPDGSGTAYKPGASFAISENMVLYAQWNKKEPADTSSVSSAPVSSSSSSSSASSPSSSSSSPSSSSSSTSSSMLVSSSSATVNPEVPQNSPTPAVSSSKAKTGVSKGSVVPSEAPSHTSPTSSTSKPKAGSDNSGVPIETPGTPAVVVTVKVWSLISLIMAVVGMLTSIVLTVLGITHRNKEKDAWHDTTAPRRKLHTVMRLAAIVVGAVLPVFFLVVSDSKANMVLVDSWTPYIAMLFLLQVVFWVVMLLAGWSNQPDDAENR